ncbi:hypothetical protein IPZ58_02830 [Streptomyces roseoverticillatus]|uniref:hypothetical protein n=1 Tax=Streptomyces roseoverticillatus TaxID=66429 RepID=UPI001F2AFFCC|nr:hypothetical protein [Streptomyces roseoverticillatus]MCF3100511.1 hypothetical protein [Streptomyces roseoverticillatus]
MNRSDASREPFTASHTTPVGGLDFWQAPDATKQPDGRLAPGVEVQLLERAPSGWARVRRASGGWPVWVDGRRLEEPASSAPADGELVPKLQAALSTCSRLLEDLAAKRIDAPSFRAQAFAAGLVVHDGEAWMWDFTNGWYCYDGAALRHVELPGDAQERDEGREVEP